MSKIAVVDELAEEIVEQQKTVLEELESSGHDGKQRT